MASEWGTNFCRIGGEPETVSIDPDSKKIQELRKKIEPWLSAVFQSEHFALLLGNGFSTAIAHAADAEPTSMGRVEFGCELQDEVNEYASGIAERAGRGEAGYLRVYRGLLQSGAAHSSLGYLSPADYASRIAAKQIA